MQLVKTGGGRGFHAASWGLDCLQGGRRGIQAVRREGPDSSIWSLNRLQRVKQLVMRGPGKGVMMLVAAYTACSIQQVGARLHMSGKTPHQGRGETNRKEI